MSQEIFANVDKYIAGLFALPDDVLSTIERNNAAADIPAWNVSANQGKFLQVLARLCSAKRILELGTSGGYSAWWLARALPENGKLISLELNAAHAEVARENMRLAHLDHIVEVRVGKALDLLPAIADQGGAPFDMVFLDADKPPYTEYLEWAIRLSRPGTLIVADNVVRDGKVLDGASEDAAVRGVQRFNEALAKDARVTATIIQCIGVKDHDGMAIAVVN